MLLVHFWGLFAKKAKWTPLPFFLGGGLWVRGGPIFETVSLSSCSGFVMMYAEFTDLLRRDPAHGSRDTRMARLTCTRVKVDTMPCEVQGMTLPKWGIVSPTTVCLLKGCCFMARQEVSASSVHAEFGSSVHAGPDRLCTRAFFAPDRLYTQCLLLCTRRDRGVDSCMFPCLSVV